MLLIPMEAQPTSRKSSAARTLHLEGEPPSNDLPGVLQGKEKGLRVKESSAHRAAGLSTSALRSSPGGLRFCDLFHRRGSPTNNIRGAGGGQMGSPTSSSLRKACHQGCRQGQDALHSTPQQAAPEGAPCQHHRVSGRETEPRTRTATRPERTELCPLLLSPNLWGFWTPDFKAQTQTRSYRHQAQDHTPPAGHEAASGKLRAPTP